MNKISALAAIFLLATSAFAADVTVSVAAAPEIIRTSASTVSLKGAASGVAGVAKVTWQTSNGATGMASGTAVWEAAGIPVAEGNTTIIVKAYDAKGASAWVGVVAVRKSAEAVISSAATLPLQPAL